MSKGATTVLTREEIYDLVWSSPLSHLAKRFNVTATTFARICDRHAIPRPWAGYWTQLESGKSPEKPPLGTGPAGSERGIRIGQQRRAATIKEDAPESPPPDAPLDLPEKISVGLLYELVWSYPRQWLAKEVGWSDVGLQKRCKKLQIPTPSRGYWAKKRAGQSLKRTKLSQNIDTDEIAIVLDQARLDADRQPTLPSRPNDADVIRLLGAIDKLGEVVIPERISRKHEVLRDAPDRRYPKPERSIWRRLDICSTKQGAVSMTVQPATQTRATILMNVLFKTLQRLGQKSVVEKEDYTSRAVTTILGERFEFAVREIYKLARTSEDERARDPYANKVTKVYTGALELKMSHVGDRGSWAVCTWRDAERRGPLEKQLLTILSQCALQAQSRRRKHEEDRLAEQKRQEEAEKRRVEDERRRREHKRVAELIKQANQFEVSARIRRLVESRQATEAGLDKSWVEWALEVADSLALLAEVETNSDSSLAWTPASQRGR